MGDGTGGQYTLDKLDWELTGIIVKEWKRWLPGTEFGKPARLGNVARLQVSFTNNFAIFEVAIQPDNVDRPTPLAVATVPFKQIITQVKTKSDAELKGRDLANKMRRDIGKVLKP